VVRPVEQSADVSRRLAASGGRGLLGGVEGRFHAVVPPRADCLVLLFPGLGPAAEEPSRVLAEAARAVEAALGCACRVGLGDAVEAFSEIPCSGQAAEERSRSVKEGGAGGARADGVAHPLLKRILGHVRDNLGTPLSLKTIAHAFGVNPAYLGRLFKKETGGTFNAYLNAQRVRTARLLLEQTPYRVAEVSFLAGFADPQYFDRVFKALTGLTPSEYRSAHL
jgi:AraC-like DNA-binding protein